MFSCTTHARDGGTKACCPPSNPVSWTHLAWSFSRASSPKLGPCLFHAGAETWQGDLQWDLLGDISPGPYGPTLWGQMGLGDTLVSHPHLLTARYRDGPASAWKCGCNARMGVVCAHLCLQGTAQVLQWDVHVDRTLQRKSCP